MQQPPTEPVWWVVIHNDDPEPKYTKVQFWQEARAILGGHPIRVVDPETLKRLEKK